MPTSAGDLSINVSTNTASVETGFNRVADLISSFARDTDRQLSGITGRFDALGSTIRGIAEISIAGFGAHAFAGMIESTIEAQSHLVDLATSAGTTASQLSALIPAAKLSGTSLDTVANSSAKFSKGLIDVQAGTGKAAEAFAALGFRAEDAARFLRDPSQGMLELAQHVNTFADSGTKTAAIIALLGKNGAELLPFLKDLGQQSEINARVTDQQAEAAKRLEDQWRELQLRGDGLRDAIVSGIVPALSDVVKAFTDATAGPDSLQAKIKGLASDGSLAVWATQIARALAILVEAIAGVIGTIAALKSDVDVILADINVAIAAANAPKVKPFGTLGFSPEEAKAGNAALDAALAERSAALARNTQVWSDLWNKDGTVLSTALGKQLQTLNSFKTTFAASMAAVTNLAANADATDRRLFGSAAQTSASKPQVNFSDSTASVNAFQQALLSAQKELAHAQQALDDLGKTESEKTAPAMRQLVDLMLSPAWDKFSGAQKDAIVNILTQAEALEKEVAAHQEAVKAIQQHADAANALNKIFEQLDNETFPDFGKILAEIDKPIESIRDSLTAQNAQLQIQVGAFGLSEAAAIRYVAAQQRIAIETSNASESIKRQALAAVDANEQLQLTAASQKQFAETLRSIDQEGQQIFESLFDKGDDTFKRLGDDIKKYLIDLLYQLTIRPILINIAASVIPGASAQSVAGAAGGGAGIGSLFGGLNATGLNPFAGGNGGLSSLLGSGPGFLGLQSVSSSMATLGIALDAGVDAVGGFSSVLGAAAGVAAPFIPLLAAAVPLLGSLFGNNEPSQVHARFNITPTGTGAGTNEGGAGGTVASPYGDLGFNDRDTMYFSGSAGAALSQIVSGALQAFLPRLSGEQNQRLTQTLQNTNFGTFEGTYTTEDFIKTYGGDILKKVVVAAFNELDPALASVAAGFSGTADDIAKAANSLLAIHDATQAIGNDTFTQNVDQALQGADQATLDKVLAFVTIVQGAGTALEGLSQHMQALDPAQITKFVDALGGAQQALQGLAYINANFTTSAQQVAQAQTNLNSAWTAAGVTMDDLARAGLTHIPQTHAEFLQLLNSLDLNTTHGEQLAASLINKVAPAFVAVQGTAEAAAQKLLQEAQSGRDYYTQHFLTPEEQTQQRIGIDETSLYEATKGGTLLNKVLHDMGYDVIPSTVEGVRQWHDAVIAKYGADSDEAHAMEATIPIIGDLIDATNGWGDAATSATGKVNDAINSLTVSVGSVIEQAVGAANDVLSSIGNLVDADTGDFGTKLAEKIALINTAIKNAIPQAFPNGTAYEAYVNTLKGSVADYTTQLAEFNRLTLLYGADVAEQLVGLETWRNGMYQLFKNMPEDLATVDAIFARKWDSIVNGTKDGLSQVQQSIEDFIKSLGSVVDQSHGTLGQRLSIEAAIGFSKVNDLVGQLAAAPVGSPLAASLTSDISKLSVYNGKLVGYIADFTTLTAQYGSGIADQLVALEMWRDTEADTLRSLITDPTQLASALGTLNDIFTGEWQSIIDGTKNGVSETQKALQGIADYLKGLFTSDVSPLKPGEQFAFEKTLFDTTFAKAQGGDVQAINDLPKIADTLLHIGGDFLSVSSEAFRDLFATVTTDLGNLAGTQPNGLPLDSNAAIVSALPVNSKLASSEDIETLKEAMTELETAVANSNSEDLADVKALLLRIANAMTSTTSPLRANA